MGARFFLETLLVFSLLLAGFGLVLLLPLPARLGAIDFRPYWSASYLFARRLDFGDWQALDKVQRTLTASDEPFTMQAWFTPIGHLLLLPLTFLPFQQAVKIWLLLNIAFLSFSAWLLWEGPPQKAWLALVIVFSFSMTLTSLYFGQVNTLVLLGLALFLYFRRTQNDLPAGASLVLTLVKPHLVVLTLPILLLSLAWHRRWQALVGFLLSLAFLGGLLFVLHPGWVISFGEVIQSGLGSFRLTPSLAGLLVYLGFESLGKWLWLGGLVLVFLVWWKYRGVDERTLLSATLLLGLSLTPFGWSYDQIVLLLPGLAIAQWTVQGEFTPPWKRFFAAGLVLINGLAYYQRIVAQNDLWFFWMPLALFGVYGIGWVKLARLRVMEQGQAENRS
ncbi:MAG: glycosyltransferase 87 family protein [Anaerolineales bacterium]|nr:glycosyltransferase 87 family protein [Anaerolineales bacterium]MDW8161190.1 glycosyltransferase 87 family protein [Anaerolineales bacterium]